MTNTPAHRCSIRRILCANPACGGLLHDLTPIARGVIFFRCNAKLRSSRAGRVTRCHTWNRVELAGPGPDCTVTVATAEERDRAVDSWCGRQPRRVLRLPPGSRVIGPQTDET